jgi:anti-sigma factor RsiW
MNCEEIRHHWNLYHDSEGDAALHLRLNEHLSSCPACAEWFYKQSLFEDLLNQHLAPQPPDPQLWQSVLAGAGVLAPTTRPTFVRPVLLIACLAAVFLMAVSLSFLWVTPPSGGPPSLSAQAANWHNRLAGGELAATFQSASDQKVEDYLRRQVSFPVRCPPRKDAGFAVQGAGTCAFGGEQAAFLVGNVEQTPVSIFVLARDSLNAFPHQAAALKKEPIHRCREGNFEMALSIIDQNLVVVIGQAHGERLVDVLRAYGTYPHQPHG